MSAFTVLRCDQQGCPAVTDEYAGGPRAVTRMASTDGWTHAPLKDFCPAHSLTSEDPRESQS